MTMLVPPEHSGQERQPSESHGSHDQNDTPAAENGSITKSGLAGVRAKPVSVVEAIGSDVRRCGLATIGGERSEELADMPPQSTEASFRSGSVVVF
jgi:hypothetical protein